MCVFTHPSLHAFSGQPSNIGALCHSQMTALQMPVHCSQNCNSISNKAAYWSDQKKFVPLGKDWGFPPHFRTVFFYTASNKVTSVLALSYGGGELDYNLTEDEFQTLAYRLFYQENCKKKCNSFKVNIKTKFYKNAVDVTSGTKHRLKV